MKKLDTKTVLEIIKMIDKRLVKVKKCQIVVDAADDIAYFNGKEDILTSLSKHLQSFIEETEFPDPKSACSACGSHDSDHLCPL